MKSLREPFVQLRNRGARYHDLGTLIVNAVTRLRYESERYYHESGDKSYGRKEAGRIVSELERVNPLAIRSLQQNEFFAVALSKASGQQVYRMNFVVDGVTFLARQELSADEIVHVVGHRFVEAIVKANNFTDWQRERENLSFREYLLGFESLRRGINRDYGRTF